MRGRAKQIILTALLVAMTTATMSSGLTASAQQRSYGVNQVQVGRLLSRIDTRWNQFRRSLDSDFTRTRTSNNLTGQLTAFEEASRRFRAQVRQRTEGPNDVSDLLTQAGSIDSYVRSRRAGGLVTQQWNLLRSDLDSLARYYNVSWRWDDRTSRPGGGNRGANSLRGTYRLDPSRSEDPLAVIKREARGLPPQQQERLARRLDSPEVLAIERQGRNITIASSRAPQVTFEADGRTRTEQTPRGRTVRVSAALLGDQLVVSQTGERGNDFRVTFDPAEYGQRLSVTRQLDVEGLSRPITVNSNYVRSSETAQFDIYRDVTSPIPTTGNGAFVARDGTQLIARLNEPLDTRQARQSDRFSMTVQSPPEYAGAVIEGYVGQVERSGRLTGRAELALNFERIRLRNGATQAFEGYIESVRSPNGDNVRVDNEGVIAERKGQTTETVTRGGIGAALGAVIGAIAGGGKGAAIGAAVGAGAGAGSVFIQGRDDLELANGTEFTIRANAPRYRGESGR